MSDDSARDYHRWELPDVGLPERPEAEADLPPQPTVRELEEIQQQARDEGRAAGLAEGLAEGRAEARRELLARMAQLDAVYEATARPLQAFDDEAVQELTQLAMVVARRVVAHELRLAPELVADAVREAAHALPAATREPRIYLHPEDLALLRTLDVGERHWQLLADPALARGDCRIESERSRLDARLETRLAAAIDAVLGEAGRTHREDAP